MFSLILNYISYNNIVDETNQENETMQSSNSSSSGGTYQTPAGISANASNGTAENGDIHTHMAVRGRPNQQDLLLHDGLTDDSMIAEVDMTQAQKKRKLEDLYSTHDFSKIKIDEYELIKLKRIIRNNIYRTVKFLRGEGNSNMGTRTDMMRSLKSIPVIGKSHDFADLNKKTGYEVEILKMCGLEEGKKTLTQRCDWWKTYCGSIKKELRNQRGRQQYNIRKTIIEGTC